jgi:hypothetical protein
VVRQDEHRGREVGATPQQHPDAAQLQIAGQQGEPRPHQTRRRTSEASFSALVSNPDGGCRTSKPSPSPRSSASPAARRATVTPR